MKMQFKRQQINNYWVLNNILLSFFVTLHRILFSPSCCPMCFIVSEDGGEGRGSVIWRRLAVLREQLSFLALALRSRSLRAFLLYWVLGNAVFTV